MFLVNLPNMIYRIEAQSIAVQVATPLHPPSLDAFSSGICIYQRNMPGRAVRYETLLTPDMVAFPFLQLSFHLTEISRIDASYLGLLPQFLTSNVHRRFKLEDPLPVFLGRPTLLPQGNIQTSSPLTDDSTISFHSLLPLSVNCGLSTPSSH